MKISKRQLRRIIKEERRRLLEQQARSPEMAALQAAIEALAKVDGWDEVADVLGGNNTAVTDPLLIGKRLTRSAQIDAICTMLLSLQIPLLFFLTAP